MPSRIPRAPGIREKTRGVWQTLTWTGYRDQMRDFALGLAAIGFKRGDKLSVVGDNRPQLYIAQLAAQVLGGISVPVYQDSIASELVYVLNHAETSVIVAEDQEQVDKALSLKDKLPKLRWIIYDDPRGLSFYDDPILRSYDSVLEEGRKFGAANPGFYEAELAKGGADDTAMIAYTSGTTGSPKGAMLSHRNMIATAEAFIEVNEVKAGDNWLSYLPMAWVGDAAFTLGMALVGPADGELPGESRDRAARPARAWPRRHAGAAAHLGEHADPDADQGQRRLADEAPRVRVFPRAGRALRAEAQRRQAVVARRPRRPGAGRDLRLRPGARPARPAQGALVLHRRRAAGARHLSLLPLLRHQPQAGLRRHRGVGADRLPGRRRGQSQHRGPADPAHRSQDRRSRRGAAEGLQRLQGLLQAGRGDARHRHVGRLAEDRRCRLLRQAGPPGHHRPRQGRRQAFRRLGLRAAIHREQAEVQPVHPRGGGVRRPAAVRRRHDRHRHADRRHLGGEAGARLHELHGPQQQARGRRHDRRGDRQGQRHACRTCSRSSASCC